MILTFLNKLLRIKAMFKSKHYQGNGALTEHSENTSSYADICSAITTSNVVETTTRGGLLQGV